MVYSWIHERGLEDYYLLRKKGTSIRRSRPAPALSEGFDLYRHLDDPEFLRLYCEASAEGSETSGERSMQFYLEGVHCTACVWLTEKVADWVEGVRSIRLDLGHSLATVKLGPDGSFSQVARELLKLGYRPHAVKQDEAKALEERENHRALIRMAVAGAAAGNIMLLAVSIYAGATGAMARSFEWVSFLICLPVATYCAWPFYRSAWSALRSRQLSIDIPIALGLGVGFAASVAGLLIHSRHVYFDTVSSLVFLLLASRYFLRKTQQEALHASRLIHFLTPSIARRKILGEDRFEEVKTDELRAGDQILVLAGECIAADGVVRAGISTLNCSLLTGESRQELVQPQSAVFAGTLNQQAPLEIEVRVGASATRLSRILASMEERLSRKAPIVAFTDRISRIFVLVTLVLVAVAFFAGLRVSSDEAVSRALAMAIVACPCAFAFATPLALSVAMGRCAKHGILVKGPDVIEKLAQVDRVVLDKTGTLTTGEFEVQSWTADADAPEVEEAVYALETRSAHPIARALIRFLKPRMAERTSPEVTGFSERIGRGVSGQVGGRHYAIHGLTGPATNASETGTRIAVERDGQTVAHAVLGDALRGDSREAVNRLREMGLGVGILSGDSRSAVTIAAHQLGIDAREALSEMSPEAKSAFIRSLPRALMVGDGANDAVALASAYVGVAVHSGLEVSMRAADVYQCMPGVMPVARLVEFSRETLKVIHRNFAFSLVYNLVGTVAAVSGHMNPLFAAVLMPISAVTVFVSSIAGTRSLRRIGRQMQAESAEGRP